MPTPRKKKGASSAPHAYPSGPVLLGHLVDALDVPIHGDRDRTSYRTLAGEVVEESSLLEMCGSVGAAIVDTGVSPSTDIAHAKPMVALALFALVKHWDYATAEHRVRPTAPLDVQVMTVGAAQLFVIDLAIRTGAWLSLTGSQAMLPDAPPSLATTMERALASTRLSRQRLASLVGVQVSTLRRWRAGTARPTYANLEQLAAHLGETVTISQVRRELAAAATLERLGELVARGDIEVLWAMFVRTTHRARAFLDAQPPEQIVGSLRGDLVVFGSQHEKSAVLVQHLRDHEAEFHWIAAIDSQRDWSARIHYVHTVASHIGALRDKIPDDASALIVGVLLAEADGAVDQLVEIAKRSHPSLTTLFESHAHLIHAAIARRRGNRAEAVRRLQAAKQATSDPQVHLRVLNGLIALGALDEAMTQAASEDLDGRGDVDARALWAAKQVAIGNVLDGHHELECLYKEGSRFPDLLANLGCARLRVGDTAGALELLEEVLAMPPFDHHALVHDVAAECAFRIGKNKRGLELARRASRLGVDRTYRRWLLANALAAADSRPPS